MPRVKGHASLLHFLQALMSSRSAAWGLRWGHLIGAIKCSTLYQQGNLLAAREVARTINCGTAHSLRRSWCHPPHMAWCML